MPTPPLEALSLTHIRYQENDRLGLVLAWVSSIPLFITMAGLIAHFIFRYEFHGLFYLLGLMISQFVNLALKEIVQQPRPSTCAWLEVCDSYGWPSNHTQNIFFSATYFTLLTYNGIGLFGKKTRFLVSCFSWFMGFLTMFARVYLGYHTVGQVVAGAVLGTSLGAFWFWIINSLRHHLLHAMQKSFQKLLS